MGRLALRRPSARPGSCAGGRPWPLAGRARALQLPPPLRPRRHRHRLAVVRWGGEPLLQQDSCACAAGAWPPAAGWEAGGRRAARQAPPLFPSPLSPSPSPTRRGASPYWMPALQLRLDARACCTARPAQLPPCCCRHAAALVARRMRPYPPAAWQAAPGPPGARAWGSGALQCATSSAGLGSVYWCTPGGAPTPQPRN